MRVMEKRWRSPACSKPPSMATATAQAAGRWDLSIPFMLIRPELVALLLYGALGQGMVQIHWYPAFVCNL